LILAGRALTPTEASAASITYSIVSYPALQGGYTVSGTITTNGDTSPDFGTPDLTGWNITVSDASGTVFELTPQNSMIPPAPLSATQSAITVPFTTPPGNLFTIIDQAGDAIAWENVSSSLLYSGTYQSNVIFGGMLPPTAPIASVIPEPSAAVLAGIGALAAFLACGWSRNRRAQRRQAAA
jgi:hypothetical protein